MKEKSNPVNEDISIHYQPLSKPTDQETLTKILSNPVTFQYHTDLMLEMEYNQSWSTPVIKPYTNLSIDPATSALHYAQSIFEGMKVYSQPNGISLFRPLEHAQRFNLSASRIGLPTLPTSTFLKLITEFTISQKEWVPKGMDKSLYLRPLLFATSPTLRLAPSTQAKFLLFGSPVSKLYSKNSISVYVEEQLSRASKNGTGSVKYSGNYGGSMTAATNAAKASCDQVLWLDAAKHKYIEELSGMNIFFVEKSQSKTYLVTPKLNSTVLSGITRSSLLILANDLGYKVKERDVTIQELISKIKSGIITELFACGTMIEVMNISSLHYKGENITLPSKKNSVTNSIQNYLANIKHGKIADKHNFNYPL